MHRILIIEDEPAMRKQMAQFLRFEGFETFEAENGRRGAATAIAAPPDLIICDILMPDLDGFGVLQALRENPRTSTIPFIFLTALGANHDLRHGMDEGADDYLTKPYQPDALLTSVRRRLEKRDSQIQENLLRAEKVVLENITQCQQAEDALRWQTGFMEAQTNTLMDGILVTDQEGRILLQNQALRDLFKLPLPIAEDKNHAKQLVWSSIRTKNPEEFVEKVVYLYAHPGELSRDEIELINGTVLDCSTSPVIHPDGTHYGRLWTFRDITEGKQTGSQLRKLSRAVEQSPVSIVITDLAGGIEYVNPKFCAVSGYSFKEVRGRNPRLLKSGEKPPEAYRQMWATLAAGEEWHGEFHNRRKNGELYWESATISPLRNDRGKVTHFIAVKEDISRVKRAEEALRSSQRLQTEILNNIPDPAWLKDAQGRYLAVNQPMARIYGLSLENIIGRTIAGIFPERAADFLEGDNSVIRSGKPVRTEHCVVDAAGCSRWFETIESPIFDESGAYNGIVGIARDISERRRVAQELSEYKQSELRSRLALEHEQKLSQIKDRFANLVSHEFRNPLSVITMAAGLLDCDRDVMTGAERSEQLKEIQGAVGRMTQMLTDFLVHGVCTSGKMECQPAPVEVEKLCRRLIAEVPGNPGSSPSIECAIDPTVGEAWLDEKILRHILGNLLSNAVKYSSAGQPVKLEVRRIAGHPQPNGGTDTAAEPHLVFKVSDSGIGIPAADLPRLYETFHRAANVGNRPGTGMGLAIVKQFVDLHRGTIRFESQEGIGTTVWVRLPIASPASPPER
jgi:PAS domain S-box-containing protein